MEFCNISYRAAQPDKVEDPMQGWSARQLGNRLRCLLAPPLLHDSRTRLGPDFLSMEQIATEWREICLNIHPLADGVQALRVANFCWEVDKQCQDLLDTPRQKLVILRWLRMGSVIAGWRDMIYSCIFPYLATSY